MKQVILGNPLAWKYRSPATAGFHAVVTPKNSECTDAWVFRLNMLSGSSYELVQDSLELSGVVIDGKVALRRGDELYTLNRFDSFYLPAGCSVTLEATEDLFIYIGGAVYEGDGEFFIRRFDLSLPLGDVHQIHGKPPYEREVFMTIDHNTPGSRLITGLTWGRDGAWTSWPPHQHEKDLDEVYCYFDLDPPAFGLHLSYREAGKPEVAHIVTTGDCVAAPRGYHPTVAIPGMHNSYFWVLASHSHKSRRYDLSVEDPKFAVI